MSGPKSAEYTLMAQQLEARRREAEALARAQEARRLEEERLHHLAEARQLRRHLSIQQANLAERMSTHQGATDAPTIPNLPDIDDESRRGIAAVRINLGRFEVRLLEIARLMDMADSLANLEIGAADQGQSVSQMLDRFVSARNITPKSTVQNASLGLNQRRAAVDRILGKVRGESINNLSAVLETLLQRAMGVEGDSRFDMLCTELQLQVQTHNELTDRRLKGMQLASQWLDQLKPLDDEALFSDLVESLSDISAGRQPWNDDMLAQCNRAMAVMQATEQTKRDVCAARILEYTLRDLGYEVDEIQQTLFSEGGAVYFQSQEWGEHQMRLRVIPGQDTIHFNMVRPASTVASPQVDQQMEHHWCSQYPKLMETLAARGLKTTPLRALKAGAIEVECVDIKVLPKRKSKQARASMAPPKQATMPIKNS